MTKTTKTTPKKIAHKTETVTSEISPEIADRQTSRDMLVAAFIVSVTVNVFILTVWVVLNVAGSETATLSVVLGR